MVAGALPDGHQGHGEADDGWSSANIDTDIIICEEPPTGSTKKPEELYQVIERFAQGGHHCSGTACLAPALSTNFTVHRFLLHGVT